MGNYRVGGGFIGSADLQTSVANAEIIPTGKTCYKFSFINHNASCHVIINGGSPIFLTAGQGFDSSIEDMWISSFKIVESSVLFNFVAAIYG